MKILVSIIILVHCACFSQNNVDVNYIPKKIKDLTTIHQLHNKETLISIYSIQLISSEDPDKILKVKKRYLSKFPQESAEEVFETPYFKLIIGHYLDKKLAEKKLKQVKPLFRSSFVLKHEITIEQFKQSKKELIQ